MFPQRFPAASKMLNKQCFTKISYFRVWCLTKKQVYRFWFHQNDQNHFVLNKKHEATSTHILKGNSPKD